MCLHTRKAIFFAQLVGRVQLARYKERCEHWQNRSFDEELQDSRKNYLFDTARSSCSINKIQRATLLAH